MTLDEDLQKAWECEHARMQYAEFLVWIAYVNRLHRSGPWGERAIVELEADAERCRHDEERARAALCRSRGR